MVTPSLSTMAQPIGEIARYATNLLIDRLTGLRHESNQQIILYAELVQRHSTAQRES